MLNIVRLYLPLLLLVLPWGLLPVLQALEPAMQRIIGQLPLVLSLIATLLAIGFKRGRIALAAVHLGCAGVLLDQAAARGLDHPSAYVFYALTSLVIPLLHGAILIQRDTSLLTPRGLIKLALLLTPYLVLAGFWQAPGRLAHWLPSLNPMLLEMVWPHHLLSQAATWLAGPVLVLALLLTLVRRSSDETALFGSLLAMTLAIAELGDPMLHTALMLIAQLLLIAAVIQHIYAMAFVDTLTGVPARRALEHRLASLGRTYSIAMLDIDHFKRFNDTYGHDVGDQVLRMVAAQLRKVQAGGNLFRYGGEEFTIVFSGKLEEETLDALDRVRKAIEHYPMQVRAPQRPKSDKTGKRSRGAQSGQQQTSVTISIGVAQREGDERPAQVIKRADQALYKAKGAGRNRVMKASPQPRASRSSRTSRVA